MNVSQGYGFRNRNKSEGNKRKNGFILGIRGRRIIGIRMKEMKSDGDEVTRLARMVWKGRVVVIGKIKSKVH